MWSGTLATPLALGGLAGHSVASRWPRGGPRAPGSAAATCRRRATTRRATARSPAARAGSGSPTLSAGAPIPSAAASAQQLRTFRANAAGLVGALPAVASMWAGGNWTSVWRALPAASAGGVAVSAAGISAVVMALDALISKDLTVESVQAHPASLPAREAARVSIANSETLTTRAVHERPRPAVRARFLGACWLRF